MKLTIDTTDRTLTLETEENRSVLGLYTKEAFELISQQWIKVGWDQKYPYTFSWFGRPIIQLPEDLIRIQEVIYRIRPDVIIETGIAHGGSLIYYASLCKAMSHGRVIGVDIEIKPENRRAIEEHELSKLIVLIEGSSVAPEVVQTVHSSVKPGETTLILLDSNHTRAHVASELEAYHDLVTPGSYVIATDGVMKDLYDVPRGRQEWESDNPAAAAIEFAKAHSEFVIEEPALEFNEGLITNRITYWPSAFIRRIR